MNAFCLSQDDESSFLCCVKNELDVDQKPTHVRSDVVLETLDLARYVMPFKTFVVS